MREACAARSVPHPGQLPLAGVLILRVGQPALADVGTGSGAVAVALAVNRPGVEVWATDTNEDAVELARANAERHGVADRVHLLQGDLLEPVPVRSTSWWRTSRISRSASTTSGTTASHRTRSMRRAPGDGLDPYRRLLDACREGRLVSRAVPS